MKCSNKVQCTMADLGWGIWGKCPPPPPLSLSRRAIAASFDRNTIYFVIVVRTKSIYIRPMKLD